MSEFDELDIEVDEEIEEVVEEKEKIEVTEDIDTIQETDNSELLSENNENEVFDDAKYSDESENMNINFDRPIDEMEDLDIDVGELGKAEVISDVYDKEYLDALLEDAEKNNDIFEDTYVNDEENMDIDVNGIVNETNEDKMITDDKSIAIQSEKETLNEDFTSISMDTEVEEHMYLENDLNDNKITSLSEDDMEGITTTMNEYDINHRNSFIYLDPNAELKKDDFGRPSIKNSVKKQLYELQTDNQGMLRDCKGRELAPESIDVGHKNEFRKLQRLAESRDLTREQFVELSNDIDNLELQNRHINRNHSEEFRGGIREDLIINNPAIERIAKKGVAEVKIDDELLDEIDNIMKDDFKDENKLVNSFDNMNDDELIGNLNNIEEELRKQKEFNSYADQLNEEQLKILKEKIESGDREILEIFGMSEEEIEDEGVTYKKKYPH